MNKAGTETRRRKQAKGRGSQLSWPSSARSHILSISRPRARSRSFYRKRRTPRQCSHFHTASTPQSNSHRDTSRPKGTYKLSSLPVSLATSPLSRPEIQGLCRLGRNEGKNLHRQGSRRPRSERSIQYNPALFYFAIGQSYPTPVCSRNVPQCTRHRMFCCPADWSSSGLDIECTMTRAISH